MYLYHISFIGADHIITVTEKSMWKYQEDVKTEKVNKSVGNIKKG